jgi:hypothetical protein
VCSVLLLGASGLLIYSRSAISAAVGLTSHEEYLRQHAPEYEKTQFVNGFLAGERFQGRMLVFLRHGFYLRVPFLYGDPAASWAIDPSRFRTTEEWKKLFKSQDIRLVVRSPEYPLPIAAPLRELENQGNLVPVAHSEISDFQGLRISGERQMVPVVILRINP